MTRFTALDYVSGCVASRVSTACSRRTRASRSRQTESRHDDPIDPGRTRCLCRPRWPFGHWLPIDRRRRPVHAGARVRPDVRRVRRSKRSAPRARASSAMTRLCLVNHFQGRVDVPLRPEREAATRHPGSRHGRVRHAGHPHAGHRSAQRHAARPSTRTVGKTVQPQCTDRTADKTVYCSCRCADINGDAERRQLLQLPERLHVHAARELAQRGLRPRPHRRLLHQERYGLRLERPTQSTVRHLPKCGVNGHETAARSATPGERDPRRARPSCRARGRRLPLRSRVRPARAKSPARAPRARRGGAARAACSS